jgi:RHO1 GDP-GTP exchange protein 1/2
MALGYIDKMLWAYSLEAMIPPSANGSTTNNQASRHPQKVTQSTNVQYFGVGTIKDKTLLVYMKRRGLESHFKVLEPVISPQHASDKNRGLGAIGSRRFGIGRTEWFKEYKQLYIPSESYSVGFLRSKLCVVCTRGFEIVNLDTLLPTTIPDFSEPEFASIARQCEGAKPLGMFRLGDNEFLLCYDREL